MIRQGNLLISLSLTLQPAHLSGGEDYELLFTIDQNDYNKIAVNDQISIVGHVTEKEEGSILITKGGNTHKLTAQGWNAFE